MFSKKFFKTGKSYSAPVGRSLKKLAKKSTNLFQEVAEIGGDNTSFMIRKAADALAAIPFPKNTFRQKIDLIKEQVLGPFGRKIKKNKIASKNLDLEGFATTIKRKKPEPMKFTENPIDNVKQGNARKFNGGGKEEDWSLKQVAFFTTVILIGLFGYAFLL